MTKKNKPTDTAPVLDLTAELDALVEGKGLTQQGGDVVGFYDNASVIVFTPLEAKLSDSRQDATKASCLIIGRLEKDTMLVLSGGDGQHVDGRKGDLVGVWAKPGMSALRNLTGVLCAMAPAGEKDTGKQNMLKLFDIRASTKGSRLEVTADNRKMSKSAKHFLSANVPQAARPMTAEQQAAKARLEADVDDIPF